MKSVENEQSNLFYGVFVFAGLIASFFIAAQSWASWDYDGGFQPSTLKSIEESLPVFEESNGKCKSKELADNLQKLLSPANALVAKEMEGQFEILQKSRNDGTTLTPVALLPKHKTCLGEAVRQMKDITVGEISYLEILNERYGLN